MLQPEWIRSKSREEATHETATHELVYTVNKMVRIIYVEQCGRLVYKQICQIRHIWDTQNQS